MEINKNQYYDAMYEDRPVELAIRSDFKGDYNNIDYCITQIRERFQGKTITRYKVMTTKDLRSALGLSQKARLHVRG